MTAAVIKKTDIHYGAEVETSFQKNIIKCGHVTTGWCKQEMPLEGAIPSEVQNGFISTF